MSIRSGPSSLPRIAVNLDIIGRGRTRTLEGSQEREDWFGTNSKLGSAIFGPVFGFDHGHFGARRDANIGMKPKAPPLEKM